VDRGKPVANVVDIGPDAHGDDRDTERFADLERGKSVRVKKVAENEIRRKAADMRKQNMSDHPPVERSRNQGQNRVVVVAGLHAWQAVGSIEFVVNATPRLEQGWVYRVGIKDSHIRIPG
jgi:hypothetical protein